MTLRRLCKQENSYPDRGCPAMYVDEDDPTRMVGQGVRLDRREAAELREVADDELGVAIPTETVLRGVGLFLAERGRPAVLAEIESYLATPR